MGGSCGAYETQKCIEDFDEKTWGKNHLEERGAKRIIIQRNSDTSVSTGFIWLRIRTIGIVNVTFNPFVAQNARNFLTHHVNHYLPKKYSAACKELHSDSATSSGRLAVNS
jgi:hypothetical protein